MSYLPSKKIAVALLFVIVLFLFVYFYDGSGGVKVGESENSVVLGKNNGGSINHAQKLDDDGDGLANWEEILWKTDPQNPDTDSDGTPDGEEVGLRRDPALAGPDDFIAQGNNLTGLSEAEALDKTRSTAIDLFSKYLEATRLQKSLSEAEKSSIPKTVSETFLKEITSDQASLRFSSRDIKVVGKDIETLRKYGNTLGAILLKYEEGHGHGTHEDVNPIIVLSDLLETKDQALAKELKSLAEKYTSAALEMAEVPTPRNILPLHLDFTNNLFKTGENISDLGNVLIDPLSSLSALPAYIKRASALSQSLRNLKVVIKSSGINYTSQEAGFIFMGNI